MTEEKSSHLKIDTFEQSIKVFFMCVHNR